MNKKKKKNSTICKKKYLRCRRPNDRSTTNRKKMEDERTTTTYFFAPKNWYLTNFFPSLFMITFDVKKRKTLPGYLWILSAERFIIIITAYQIYFDEKNRNYAACVRERKVKRIFFLPPSDDFFWQQEAIEGWPLNPRFPSFCPPCGAAVVFPGSGLRGSLT